MKELQQHLINKFSFNHCFHIFRDGPLEKSDGGGGGEKTKKKFKQGKMSEKKIHAQDGPHFDMKP